MKLISKIIDWFSEYWVGPVFLGSIIISIIINAKLGVAVIGVWMLVVLWGCAWKGGCETGYESGYQAGYQAGVQVGKQYEKHSQEKPGTL